MILNPTIFRGEDLSYSYQSQALQQAVLNKINFEIRRGEFVCLSGPSGSGKSTLLNLLGLIEPPQTGRLEFRGEAVNGLSDAKLNKFRRYDISFIFQDFQLIEVLTVEENIEYFLHRQGVAAAERRQIVSEALEDVQLTSHRHKRPSELSGGQRQRVGIARALAKRPTIIIADEPTASLDLATGRSIMAALAALRRKHQATIVIASHDPMVFEYVSKVVKIQDGRIIATEEVNHHAG